jgi:hypothetical protein
MNLRKAFAETLRSKRFWTWQLSGAILYAIPVAIRFITRSSYIPILSLPGYWIWHYIPGNLVEKILINAFFPGGAGAVAGEIFMENYRGTPQTRARKYAARLGGAMVQTAAWSAFQFAGYLLMIVGPFGGNIFEAWYVFPFNFLLAALSIFTPDVVHLAKLGVLRVKRKVLGWIKT